MCLTRNRLGGSGSPRTLGATLFVRTTRAVTLTETGADYLARITPILEDLEAADDAARGDGELRGTLHIGVSSIMASRVLVPLLSEFLSPHPLLRIELAIDDRRQDLIAKNVDVAIRFGTLPDSSAIARHMGRWPLVIAAAPSYIAKNGKPRSPNDLHHHNFIIAGPAAKRELTFRQGDKVVAVPVNGPLAITGAEVAVNAAVSGLGLVAASYPSVTRELESGALVRLLPDWDLGELKAHALFPGGQSSKPSARAFVEFLFGHVRAR